MFIIDGGAALVTQMHLHTPSCADLSSLAESDIEIDTWCRKINATSASQNCQYT